VNEPQQGTPYTLSIEEIEIIEATRRNRRLGGFAKVHTLIRDGQIVRVEEERSKDLDGRLPRHTRLREGNA
jgi:hypothetical protein